MEIKLQQFKAIKKPKKNIFFRLKYMDFYRKYTFPIGRLNLIIEKTTKN